MMSFFLGLVWPDLSVGLDMFHFALEWWLMHVVQVNAD